MHRAVIDTANGLRICTANTTHKQRPTVSRLSASGATRLNTFASLVMIPIVAICAALCGRWLKAPTVGTLESGGKAHTRFDCMIRGPADMYY